MPDSEHGCVVSAESVPGNHVAWHARKFTSRSEPAISVTCFVPMVKESLAITQAILPLLVKRLFTPPLSTNQFKALGCVVTNLPSPGDRAVLAFANQRVVARRSRLEAMQAAHVEEYGREC